MSRWSEDEQDDIAVTAEYVLGLLTPEEERAFEARMAVDPPFCALVTLWTEDMARMAADLPALPPPPGVEAALHRRLFPEEEQSLWRRLGVLPAILGGLAAALIVLWVTSMGWVGRPDEPVTLYEAQIAAQDSSLVVLAHFDPATGELRLHRQAGGVVPGRSQELWLVPPGAEPVSLGVLPEAPESLLSVAEDLRPRMAGAILAISDEPPGGSPTGRPTGATLAMGPLTVL
ncbi:anti-sigma factor domain-containing protein [Rubellimicrobium sp. CFH 75288]|uniref:anti-sigma factor n=1 Tax=Rubellimicrobium sp. CFH 75288 TaxID=2697034 RepID=UPI0014123FF2|nr:anti-sigma factor [Rubellimicrobium sp. CFH 75288]NAZ35378.1 hypothetical protein [Rubellimicrobium sp. CFH 75288]